MPGYRPKRGSRARLPPSPPPQDDSLQVADEETDVKPVIYGAAEEQDTSAGAEAEDTHIADSERPGIESVPTDAQAVAATAPSLTGTSAPPASGSIAQPPPKRLPPLPLPTLDSASARGKSVARPRYVGRRSQTARAELERAEAERKAAEAADRARQEARRLRDPRWRGRGGERGRGGGVRGRGGFMGESERASNAVGASGPFSLGQVTAEARRGGARKAPRPSAPVTGGGSNADEGGDPAKNTTEGTTFGEVKANARPFSSARTLRESTVTESTPVKQEVGDGDTIITKRQQPTAHDGGYISSDEDDDKGFQRKNVDELEVIDLTLDDAEPSHAMAPMRIPRVEHKERTLGLNADEAASATAISSEIAHESGAGVSEKRRGKQRARDVEITGQKARYHGNWSSSESEPEPDIKAEPTEDGDTPAMPENMNAGRLPPDVPSSPESRRKGKEKVKAHTIAEADPVRPDYQTQAEIDEWERHQSDLRILRAELGTLAATADGDGDVRMSDAHSHNASLDKRAEKVYLFQFPPVLPDLLPIRVKPDPEGAAAATTTETGGDAMQVDGPSNTAANAITVSDTAPQRQPRLPSGAVGKLRVHRSGRATLDWGGMSLSLGMGTDVSFLQDVVVATLRENKKSGGLTVGEDEKGGVAMAMGQVRGKFIVTPDWESLLG